MSKRSSFVTINPANLPPANLPPPNGSTRTAPPPSEIGSVWETKYSAEEVSLYVCLAESQPVAIVVDEDKLAGLAGVLKLLLSPTTNCFGVSVKTQRQQASKQIRKSISHNQGVLVVTPETALFAQSCFSPGVKCKTLLHIAGVESRDNWRKRSMLLLLPTSASAYSSSSGPDSFSIDDISSLGKQIVMVNPQNKASCCARDATTTLQSRSQYPFMKPAMSAIQARIATARKLYAATSEASGVWKPSVSDLDGDQVQAGGDAHELKRGIAGRIEALRAKLKILASLPISGLAENQQPSSQPAADPPRNQHSNHDSHTTRRVKMEILGMLHAPSKIEVEKQVESGRSLAATKWMDGALGQNNGHPWASVRYGASCDCCARDVREVVEALRDYVDSKAGRKLPKRENEVELATPRLKKTLKRCRVVAFGWRPSVFGEGEEWGGRYGKACSHNEVAMFFARPFAPMEVLNTHVCSLKSPAPGNEGHDGCLEFLRAQCIFFGRSFTIWDDEFFHFIDSEGKTTSVKKASLLHLDETKLRLVLSDLRAATLECFGSRSALEIINELHPDVRLQY